MNVKAGLPHRAFDSTVAAPSGGRNFWTANIGEKSIPRNVRNKVNSPANWIVALTQNMKGSKIICFFNCPVLSLSKRSIAFDQ